MTAIDLGTVRTDDPPFTFLHAADLHLGASDHVQAAFKELVKAALDRQVDAVMLAGDVYDMAERSPHLQMKFLDGLKDLDASGIHVFITHGNHDPVESTFHPVTGQMPERVHVFAPGDPQTYLLGVGGRTVAVSGVSFERKHDKKNLVARVAAAQVQADLRVAVVHANLAGQPGHDDYGPCTLDDLRNSTVDYWALGHIHKATQGDIGNGRWWAYPGNLQGRSLKPAECGAKGALVVTAGVTGFNAPKFVPCDVHRYERLPVDISGAELLNNVVEAVVEAVASRAATHRADGVPRTLTVRVELTGTVPEAAQAGSLDKEMLAEELNDDRITIDRVRNRTRRPVDRTALAQEDSLTGGVLRRLDSLRTSQGAAELIELIEQTAGTVGVRALERATDLIKKGVVQPSDLADRAEELVLDLVMKADQ